MQSDMARGALLKVIENTECNREMHKDVDNCYLHTAGIIITEMNKQLLIPETTDRKGKQKKV